MTQERIGMLQTTCLLQSFFPPKKDNSHKDMFFCLTFTHKNVEHKMITAVGHISWDLFNFGGERRMFSYSQVD